MRDVKSLNPPHFADSNLKAENLTVGISRRELLKALLAAGACVVGGSVFLSACGSADSATEAGCVKPTSAQKIAAASASAVACLETSGAAHDHKLDLTVAQIIAGSGATLTPTLIDEQTCGGSAGGHTHTVSLSSADITSLIAGNVVSTTSSTDVDHDHSVDIFCYA